MLDHSALGPQWARVGPAVGPVWAHSGPTRAHSDFWALLESPKIARNLLIVRIYWMVPLKRFELPTHALRRRGEAIDSNFLTLS